MHRYRGSCHCRSVAVNLMSQKLPGELGARRCLCSFCRKHGARTTTDPEGRLQIAAAADALGRYQFGLLTAQFLTCRKCGVFVAAVANYPDGLKATLNVNILDKQGDFDPLPPTVSYDEESPETRRERRRLNWTPAVLDSR